MHSIYVQINAESVSNCKADLELGILYSTLTWSSLDLALVREGKNHLFLLVLCSPLLKLNKT